MSAPDINSCTQTYSFTEFTLKLKKDPATSSAANAYCHVDGANDLGNGLFISTSMIVTSAENPDHVSGGVPLGCLIALEDQRIVFMVWPEVQKPEGA